MASISLLIGYNEYFLKLINKYPIFPNPPWPNTRHYYAPNDFCPFANPSKRHQNLSTYIQAKGCSTCDTNCGTMIPSTLSLRFREFYFEYCAGRWADTVATMLPSCKTGTSNRKTKPNQATEWKRNGVHPVAPVKSKLL